MTALPLTPEALYQAFQPGTVRPEFLEGDELTEALQRVQAAVIAALRTPEAIEAACRAQAVSSQHVTSVLDALITAACGAGACASCNGTGFVDGSTCTDCIHTRRGFAEKWASVPARDFGARLLAELGAPGPGNADDEPVTIGALVFGCAEGGGADMNDQETIPIAALLTEGAIEAGADHLRSFADGEGPDSYEDAAREVVTLAIDHAQAAGRALRDDVRAANEAHKATYDLRRSVAQAQQDLCLRAHSTPTGSVYGGTISWLCNRDHGHAGDCHYDRGLAAVLAHAPRPVDVEAVMREVLYLAGDAETGAGIQPAQERIRALLTNRAPASAGLISVAGVYPAEREAAFVRVCEERDAAQAEGYENALRVLVAAFPDSTREERFNLPRLAVNEIDLLRGERDDARKERDAAQAEVERLRAEVRQLTKESGEFEARATEAEERLVMAQESALNAQLEEAEADAREQRARAERAEALHSALQAASANRWQQRYDAGRAALMAELKTPEAAERARSARLNLERCFLDVWSAMLDAAAKTSSSNETDDVTRAANAVALVNGNAGEKEAPACAPSPARGRESQSRAPRGGCLYCHGSGVTLGPEGIGTVPCRCRRRESEPLPGVLQSPDVVTRAEFEELQEVVRGLVGRDPLGALLYEVIDSPGSPLRVNLEAAIEAEKKK